MNISLFIKMFGIHFEQGPRRSMEDRHFIDLDTHTYGIFDGHGGGKMSEYLGKVAPTKFHDLDFEKESLGKIFNEVNLSFKSDVGNLPDGSTLVMARVFDMVIKCCWVGDSEAWIMCEDGRMINLTLDLHNGYNRDEIDRVEKAGGHIYSGRIQGQLAVTRAFGNHCYNFDGLCVDPDVTTIRIKPTYKFLILACDGIRERYNSDNDEMDDADLEEIGKLIMDRYEEGMDLNTLAKHLVSEAYKYGSGDNTTIIIVDLQSKI